MNVYSNSLISNNFLNYFRIKVLKITLLWGEELDESSKRVFSFVFH